MTPYRILVTGSRDYGNPETVCQALADTVHPLPLDRDVVVVHGDNRKPTCPDCVADKWAIAMGITVERHPASDFGPWPACGPIRNQHMVHLGADVALAFIGACTSGRCRRPRPHPSHGATGCADLAEAAGIPTRRFTLTV